MYDSRFLYMTHYGMCDRTAWPVRIQFPMLPYTCSPHHPAQISGRCLSHISSLAYCVSCRHISA